MSIPEFPQFAIYEESGLVNFRSIMKKDIAIYNFSKILNVEDHFGSKYVMLFKTHREYITIAPISSWGTLITSNKANDLVIVEINFQ